MARFGFLANGVYNRSDPRCFFPPRFVENITDLMDGRRAGLGLPFHRMFELMYRAKKLRISGEHSANVGFVFNYEFSLYHDSTISPSTVPVNERYLVCGTSATTAFQELQGDVVIEAKLDMAFSRLYYDSEEELFYFPFSLELLDEDAGTGVFTPEPIDTTGIERSSFNLTVLGESVGLHQLTASPYTGDFTIEISEWWPYENRRGNYPIVGQTTGKKLVTKVPLGIG